MKKLCALALCLALCVGLLPSAAWAAGPEVKAKAVLLMEKSTGEILYEEHGEEPLELASVTKVMTMLLIMEALEDGTLTPDTMVAVSANAAGMGGSQVYMKEGETFSVHDMLKAIAVASGNDACVAMAEHLAGSEAAFVERMNARAAELGMENTVFCNCTGLPAEGHHSTAHDIALMSRELIRKHPDIRTYTTIWMDTLRDGSFQLANTNKLIRFYDGATGLKTGSTDGALYCISATAEKDGMELIAVVLGSPTSADRFEAA
ncbi:MAG: D-alanyl-D-alanine carboxypeptidase family protein, partial [Bacillota bacterium]|nr:D-alanyl-D-alanine carboxypeptidase family protein [Bacillota bacterium]